MPFTFKLSQCLVRMRAATLIGASSNWLTDVEFLNAAAGLTTNQINDFRAAWSVPTYVKLVSPDASVTRTLEGA